MTPPFRTPKSIIFRVIPHYSNPTDANRNKKCTNSPQNLYTKSLNQKPDPVTSFLPVLLNDILLPNLPPLPLPHLFHNNNLFGYPEFHSGMPLREAFLLVVVVPTLLENFKNDNKRYTLKRSTLVTIGTLRLLFQCSPFQWYTLKRTTLETIGTLCLLFQCCPF